MMKIQIIHIRLRDRSTNVHFRGPAPTKKSRCRYVPELVIHSALPSTIVAG